MKYLLLIVCAIISLTSFSQVDRDDFERFKREYEEGINRERENFQKYKEARDKEFADFLKKDWENFQLFAAGKPISTPGPEIIPIVEIPIFKIPQSNISLIPVAELKPIQIQARPILVQNIPILVKNIDRIKIDFYGTLIDFEVEKNISKIQFDNISENSISKFWTDLSDTEHYQLIEQLLEVKNRMYLNDFALLKLTEIVSEEIMKDNRSAKLLCWFLLNKTGYNVKAGYSGNNIYLLIPSQNQLYSYPFYTFNNIKYYIFDKSVKSLKTYDGDYPNATKTFDFNMYQAPLLDENKAERSISFNHKGKSYSMIIDYNLNHIKFYNDYPQGDIRIFFDAGMSATAKNSLIMNLDSILYKMDEISAADFLLRMTQTAFEYQTDDDQFGAEKYFFPEEVLHYPYSDCEDRSVFFAYLITEFLQLPVLGLNYPGHIATAVKFNETVKGSYFVYNDNRYVVCDPTYINAPIGLAMPEFKNSEVKLLGLNTIIFENKQFNELWNNLVSNGVYRFSNNSDIIQIDNNQFAAVGYISDSVYIKDKWIKNDKNNSQIIILISNNKGEIINYRLIQSNVQAMVYGIGFDAGKLYIAGNFTGNLICENNSIQASEREVFIASFNKGLANLWIKNTGINHEDISKSTYFTVLTDTTGQIKEKLFINEQSFEDYSAVEISGDNILFSGYFDGISLQLVDSEIYTKRNAFQFAQTLNQLNDYYLSQFYNPSISGIFAFTTIMQGGNFNIGGRELLASVKAINPEFENMYPKLSGNLRDIRKIESENGIITVYTSLLSNFKSGSLVFSNRSKLRIRNFLNGNMQIYVLSGVNYRPFIKNYDVNYIKVFRINGDILIDFNLNKDQKILNMKKDLLK